MLETKTKAPMEYNYWPGFSSVVGLQFEAEEFQVLNRRSVGTAVSGASVHDVQNSNFQG